MMPRSLFFDPLAKFRCFADADDPGEAEPAAGAGSAPPAPVDPALAAPAGDDPTAPAPQPDWKDKQIARMTRQRHEERARVTELEAENTRLRELAEAAQRRPAADPAPEPGPRRADPAPEPARAAPARRADPPTRDQVRFELEVEAMDRALKADYPTIVPKVLENLGRFDEAERVAIIRDVLNTDDAAYVMSVVGNDPAKLAELADLPQGRRQAALIKIAMDKKAPVRRDAARPSGAPAPVDPVRGAGGGAAPATATDLYDTRFEFANYYRGPKEIEPERQSDEAWFAERQRQKRESVGRPWSTSGKR